MSFPNDFLDEGDHATYTDMLSYHQTQTTESAYPDPTSLITQPLLHHEGPLPNTFDPYHQPWAADMNGLQGQDYLLPDFMQNPGVTSRTSGEIPDYCSPNQIQTTLHPQEQMTAYHSPYQTQLVSPTLGQMSNYHSPYQTQPTAQVSGGMPDYCSPYETQTLLNTQEQMAAYHDSYQMQLMSSTPGQLPDYPSPYQTQPVSRAQSHMLDYHSPYQTDSPMTDPGTNHQSPSPMSLSPEDTTTLQGARSDQKRRKTKTPSIDNDKEYPQRDNSGPASAKRNMRKKKPAILSSLASPHSLQQPELGKQSKVQKVSRLGQLKAKLGDTMGSDNRAREKVLWENGTMFGWVKKEWKPAVYHADVREKLILLDAQQPGAPVWEKGMSLNYTSYSPVMRDWTSDPASIRDLKGRQVCLMRYPPDDWTHNPKTGFLTHEGLVILDENNRPIKDFPGAPLALSNKIEARLLEGLRRTFGLTIPDAIARMPMRDTRLGPKPVQSHTTFTNRVMFWKNKVNREGPKIMFPWHDREKDKATVETADTSSGPQDEEEEEADSIADSVPPPSMDMSEASRSHDDYRYPSM